MSFTTGLGSSRPSRTTNASPTLPPSQFAALDRMLPDQQAMQVSNLFRAAKTEKEYSLASERWNEIKPNFQDFAEKMKCDEYRNKDKEIGWDLVDGLTGLPLHEIYAVSKEVLDVEIMDFDKAREDLKEAYTTVKDHLSDKTKEKSKDKIKDIYLAMQRALCKFLRKQKIGRKSTKKFEEIVEKFVKAPPNPLVKKLKLVAIAFTPNTITPDYCIDFVKIVEKDKMDAFNRIFALKSVP